MFREVVEWCLVVSTDEEAVLCAITTSSDTTESSFGYSSLRIIPTRFNISTDSVPMVKICGSPDGRIFMGGYDGSLYEMVYEGFLGDQNKKNQGNYTLSEKLYVGSKRAFQSVLPTNLIPGSDSSTFSSNSGQRHRKCRKLDHSNNKVPVMFSSVLPGFVTQLMNGGDVPIMDLVVDPERGFVHSLNTRGMLYCHDYSCQPMKVIGYIDLLRYTKAYLTSVTRGSSYPPYSNIQFPGGSTVAALGVGGMEGARILLKAMEDEIEQSSSAGGGKNMNKTQGVLSPVSIHTISKKESRNLNLMAITGAGVRLYLSVTPIKIVLSHVRAPPNIQEMFLSLSEDQTTSWSTSSSHKKSDKHCFPPGFNQRQQQQNKHNIPNVMSSFYKSGTLLLALDGNAISQEDSSTNRNYFNNSNSSDQNQIGDLIISATPNCAARKVEQSSATSSSSFVSPTNTTTTTNNNTGTNPSTPQKETSYEMVPATGISETISLPSKSSLGGLVSRVLAGGRVYEISSPYSSNSFAPNLYDKTTQQKNSLILYEQLFWASATPSDSDLNIGLVPSYCPPPPLSSSIKRPTKQGMSNNGSAVSTALTTVSGGVFSGAIDFLSKVIQSKTLSDTLLREEMNSNIQRQKINRNKYVMSSKPAALFYGCGYACGAPKLPFSSSSADDHNNNNKTNTNSTGTTPSQKSPRLPPWLLNPSVAPLHELATHHIPTSFGTAPKHIIALNSGGLHFFSRKSVLNKLASTLMHHQNYSEQTSSSIRSFFEAYGYSEGCAMALAVAIQADNRVLEKRAIDAALAHGNQPKLFPLHHHHHHQAFSTDTNGAGTTKPKSYEKIVLYGQQYESRPSSLHDGLVSLISRLLRPIWYKPAVVVSSPPLSSSNNNNNTTATTTRRYPVAAKVELLLDETTLEEARRPLFNLQKVMQTIFARVVKTVPGQEDPDAMQIEGDDDRNLITRALQFQHSKNNPDQSSRNLTNNEIVTLARLNEEKSIHSLYRLVSRASQLLSLLSLLRRAHDLPSLPEVSWGLLHGLTFSQLVTNQNAHERIQSLLSALVTFSSFGNTTSNDPHAQQFRGLSQQSAEADKLASSLGSQCYLYFSAGDRLTFQGFQYANHAYACPENSIKRDEYANEAGRLLREAAKHWKSPTLVSGRIMHQDIIDTAHNSSSLSHHNNKSYYAQNTPVANAASALMSIGNVGAIVDVCLVCASNFGGTVKGTVAEDDFALMEYQSGPVDDSTNSNRAGSFTWEDGLYHAGGKGRQRRSIIENKSNQATSKVGASTGATTTPTTGASTGGHQPIVSGVDVTASDARRACYDILLYHLGKLLRSNSHVNREYSNIMLTVATNSEDQLFIDTLFSFLIDQGFENSLLRITTPKLEKWLMHVRNDIGLLWRFYSIHDLHTKAADVMYKRAVSETEQIPLNERIECLTRAVNSLQAAASSDLSHDVKQQLKHYQEQLEIAGLQQRILSSLKERDLMSEEGMKELSTNLIAVSVLYNDYAAASGLYELCLKIIQTCNTNDPESIKVLWKSILAKEVPVRTENRSVQIVLDSLRENTPHAQPGDVMETDELFETGDWINRVKEKVILTGKDLYGKGSDYVFPVVLLVSELEELRFVYEFVCTRESTSSSSSSSSWPLICLLEVGVSYPSILNAYSELLDMSSGRSSSDPDKKLQCLTNIANVLRHWTTSAKSFSSQHPNGGFPNGKDKYESVAQLTRELNNGLNSNIDEWKATLESLVGGDYQKINECMTLFTDVERMLETFV